MRYSTGLRRPVGRSVHRSAHHLVVRPVIRKEGRGTDDEPMAPFPT